MTNGQAQELLDELNGVRPEMLNDEAKRLFEAIMKIADERDELQKTVEEKDKIIDSMAEYIDYITDEFGDERFCNEFENRNNSISCDKDCKKCIKQYFENKAKEV